MSNWHNCHVTDRCNWHQINACYPHRPSCAGMVYPTGLPAHWLAQRGCGQGWWGHTVWLPGGPKMSLPFFLGSLPAGLCCARGHLEPGSRLKQASSLATTIVRFALIWPLLSLQKGTFEGQFHCKWCCLCSSTCWLAMKHQAAKHSRHTA